MTRSARKVKEKFQHQETSHETNIDYRPNEIQTNKEFISFGNEELVDSIFSLK